MKKYFLLSLLLATILQGHSVFASSFNLVQTKDIYTGLITFDVELHTEGKQVNAVSGTITFPKDILELESIKTEGSIVPLWLVAPSLGKETFLFNGRGEISFEGVLPGGFDGVRSPFYSGPKPGKLFTITFRPVHEGRGVVIFSDATALLHDGRATKDTIVTNTATLDIPSLGSIPRVPKKVAEEETLTRRKTMDAYVVQDPSLDASKYALIITNDTTQHTLSRYEVAETNTSVSEDVRSYEWGQVQSPYILSNQKRNKFIHVKAVYADNTYEVITLPPVENISDETLLWRILITIGVISLSLYILIQKHVLPHINIHSKKAS